MTSTIKVNNIQNQCGANIINENSNTITIGASGDTIALASGASQTGFGRTGTVDWQTGDIKTSTFTAVDGQGFFADTSSGAFTMNLPAGTAGSIVSVVDYTNTFQTHNLTVTPNGSQKIGGVAAPFTAKTEGQSLTWVYVDDTEGWKNIQDSTSNAKGNAFISATGGTESTCGNCKIHTFTGPGTFTVTDTAICAAHNIVSHLIIAGGGGGASGATSTNATGGGGGGGFREVKNPATPYTASPLDGYATPANRVTVSTSPGSYPIVVGGGGTGGPAPAAGGAQTGSNSSFGGITSAGGAGGSRSSGEPGGSGGGAGGGATSRAGGTGNTPPVTPAQGSNGGGSPPANPDHAAGGGGGATEAGVTGGPGGPSGSGRGGAGATTSITGSPTAFSGGGGGSATPGKNPSGAAASPCGTGSAGGPEPSGATSPGTTNRGGGAGGATGPGNGGGNGGSGIVVIRYKIQ